MTRVFKQPEAVELNEYQDAMLNAAIVLAAALFKSGSKFALKFCLGRLFGQASASHPQALQVVGSSDNKTTLDYLIAAVTFAAAQLAKMGSNFAIRACLGVMAPRASRSQEVQNEVFYWAAEQVLNQVLARLGPHR